MTPKRENGQGGTSSEWMFYEYRVGSLSHAVQMLKLALLRALVMMVYKPIAKPLLRWMVKP